MSETPHSNGHANGDEARKAPAPHARPNKSSDAWTWVCTECDKEVGEHDKLCPHCGVRFTYLKM